MIASEDRIIEVQTIKKSQASVPVRVPDSLRLLKDKEAAPAGFGTFRVLTRKDGDKRVVWDSRDLLQIEDAKAMFDQLIQEGLVPYRVGINGKASAEVMDEFDPFAEEVVFLAVAAVVTGG